MSKTMYDQVLDLCINFHKQSFVVNFLSEFS